METDFQVLERFIAAVVAADDVNITDLPASSRFHSDRIAKHRNEALYRMGGATKANNDLLAELADLAIEIANDAGDPEIVNAKMADIILIMDAHRLGTLAEVA